MAGVVIEPSPTINVLGVVIDAQLTWEQQAAIAARRARNAMHAVHRATRHMPRDDRALLMASMAHPYLDYCQSALAQPSARAKAVLRRMYERTARVAARLAPEQVTGGGRRIWRTRPAFYHLRRWPTWDRRRAATQAAWAMSIWHRQRPLALRELLRGTPGEPMPGRPQR
eukprot:gene1151-21247_t